MLADGTYDSNAAVLNVLQQKMGSCHALNYEKMPKSTRK